MESKEFIEEAKRFARKTTHERCYLMGSDKCDSCNHTKMGNCDYKSIIVAFLKGADYAIERVSNQLNK